VDDERPLRCVHDPADQMRVPKEAHGFNPDACAGANRGRRAGRAAEAEQGNAII
jgi:hypothetical protein